MTSRSRSSRTSAQLVAALLLTGCSAQPVGEDASTTGESSRSSDAPSPLEVAGPFEDLSFSIPTRADHPFTLKNRRFGASVAVQLEGASPAERTGDDDEWTYRDALGSGNDLVLASTTAGLEDWVRLATPGRVAYRVTLGENVAGLRSLGASVEFLDARGTPVLRASRAVAIDAEGERAELQFTVEGCEVDRDPRGPWGRAVVDPGNRECVLVVDVPSTMSGPVWVDPLWTTTDNLAVARWGAQLAVAGSGPDLRVLAIGGRTGDDGQISTGVVESFDPDTLTWSTLPALPEPTIQGRAVTLLDGRVLLIGGNAEPAGAIAVTTSRLFDPLTSTWSLADAMNVARRYHTATVLLDGRVLVAGGAFFNDSHGTAEVYDPALDTWTPTANLGGLRAEAEAILLPDGKVLVTGGYGGTSFSRNSSELWDPAANGGLGAFEPENVMPGGTYGHGIAMWGTDRVIVTGGEQNFTFGLYGFDQVYDIAAKSWDAVDPGSLRAYGGAANLPDGSALIFGGCNANMDSMAIFPCIDPFDSVRMYPAGGTAAIELPLDPFTLARAKFGWVVLPDGRMIAAGGGAGSNGVVTDRVDVFEYLVLGDDCTFDNACVSGFCVDGVCCESECAGACESCAGVVIGTAGLCAAYASGTDPDGECANDGALCLQTGMCGESGCELHSTTDCDLTPCSSGSECSSGACSDGICCDVACDQTCASCRNADTGQPEGECHAILFATDPDGECVDGVAGDCAAQNLCDGDFECKSAASLCAPFSCTEQGCNDSCDETTGCADGFACIDGACIDEAELCTDGTMGLAPDGTVVDCSPFRCQPDGSCFEVCESLLQCETGLVCDDESASCVPPPSTSGGDEGCACSMETLRRPSAMSFAPWLLLVIVAARKARRRRS